MRAAGFTLAVLAGMVLLAPAAQASARPRTRCPDPRTCATYQLQSWRWHRNSAGRIVIPFYINPLQPWVSQGEAEAAILAATRTWMRANPAVRFEYWGTASNLPLSGDTYNFIGWMPDQNNASASAVVKLDESGRWPVEADIALNSIFPWKWSPCAQRNGACTTVRDNGPVQRLEIQSVVTHELGHALGLRGLEDVASRELTMYHAEAIGVGERKQQTLGLGDILGIRAAYPCGRTCPRTVVYAP